MLRHVCRQDAGATWRGLLAAWTLFAISAAAQSDAVLAGEIAALRARVAAQEKQLEQLRSALDVLSSRVAAQAPAQKTPAPAGTAELVAGSGYERIRFRNVYLSPGGFLEAVTLFR